MTISTKLFNKISFSLSFSGIKNSFPFKSPISLRGFKSIIKLEKSVNFFSILYSLYALITIVISLISFGIDSIHKYNFLSIFELPKIPFDWKSGKSFGNCWALSPPVRFLSFFIVKYMSNGFFLWSYFLSIIKQKT